MRSRHDINSEEILTQNWESKIEKIKKLIKSWKSRKLTMIGRIQVVNSLLLPQLTYLIKVLPIKLSVFVMSCFGFWKSVVSSDNCEILNSLSCPGNNFIPRMSFSCLIRAAIVSTVITNSSDDSLIPREIVSGADIQPLFIILQVVLLYIVFTHCIKELVNPKYSKVVNI